MFYLFVCTLFLSPRTLDFRYAFTDLGGGCEDNIKMGVEIRCQRLDSLGLVTGGCDRGKEISGREEDTSASIAFPVAITCTELQVEFYICFA